MFYLYLYELITFVIPKAGVLKGNIPLNLSTLMAPLIILHNINPIISFLKKRAFGVIYFIYVVSLLTLMPIHIFAFSTTHLARVIILLISPLMLILGYISEEKIFFKLLIISLMLVAGFSCVQYIYGINKTAIQGITIAYGDSYTRKSMGFDITNDTAIKMPSSYQNGNLVGLFYD